MLDRLLARHRALHPWTSRSSRPTTGTRSTSGNGSSASSPKPERPSRSRPCSTTSSGSSPRRKSGARRTSPRTTTTRRAMPRGAPGSPPRSSGRRSSTPALSARAVELIAGHDQPGRVDSSGKALSEDPDAALLEDADALSFFSLNSAGLSPVLRQGADAAQGRMDPRPPEPARGANASPGSTSPRRPPVCEALPEKKNRRDGRQLCASSFW